MPITRVTPSNPGSSPATNPSGGNAPTSFRGRAWSVIKATGKNTLAGLITLVVTPILLTLTLLGKCDLGAIFQVPSAGLFVWKSAKYFLFKEGEKPTRKTNDFLKYIYYNSNGKFYNHYDPKIHGKTTEMTSLEKRAPIGASYYRGRLDPLKDPHASAFAKLASVFQDADCRRYYTHYYPGIHDTDQSSAMRRLRASRRALARRRQEEALSAS